MALAEKFPEAEATKKKTENSKKIPKNSTIMPLPGEGYEKRPKGNKKD